MAMLEPRMDSPTGKPSVLESAYDLQREYIRNGDATRLFCDILSLLINETGSHCGFISEVNNASLDPHLNLRALVPNQPPSSWQQSGQRAELDFYKRSLLMSTVHSGLVTIANGLEVLPVFQPSLESFLGIPLLLDGHVLGLICLANREQGYNETMVRSLKPLICVCEDVFSSELRSRLRQKTRSLSEESVTVQSLNHKWQDFVNSSPMGVVEWNTHLNIVQCNSAVERIFGFEHNQILSEDLIDLIWPKQKSAAIKQQWLDKLQSGVGFSDITEHLNEFGRTVRCQWFHHPLKTDSSVYGIISLVHDITVVDEPNRSDHPKQNNFLAVMSHELRTPMNGVVGMVDLLNDTPLQTDQRRLLNTIRASAFSLLQILDDILDFSKIEAGKLHVEYLPLSVTEVVESVAETLIPNVLKKQLEFFIYVDPKIPAFVELDPVRLRQILFNLSGNAIKFTHNSANGKGRVSISAEWIAAKNGTSDYIAFKVKDTGIGISKEAQETLFNPYVQARSDTNRLYGGTGLGLSITAKLCELLGGQVELCSEEGKGSVFTVKLPVKTTIIEDVEQELPKGKTVALLSSDPELVSQLNKYLVSWGVSMTALGAEVPQQELSQFDVLILDTVYTEQDLSCIKQKNLGETTRVILLKSSSDANFGDEVVEVVCDPLLQSAFKSALAKCLGVEELVFEREYTQYDQYPQARILVAEDTEVNQDVIHQQLLKFGCYFDIVENGTKALEKWRSADYDLLLVDCFMPEMDGFQLTEAIRAEERGSQGHTPIVAFTANTLTEEVQTCLNSGMDDILAKPVELTKLAHTLDKWLEKDSGTKPPQSGRIDAASDNNTEHTPVDQLHRVLVVEDEQMNRTMFVEMISSLNFEADSVANGEEALAALQKTNYGLIITDLQMPHMDGFELAQALYKRQRPEKRTPLVMMTGTIPAENEKQVFFDNGVREFVAKPVSLNTLRSVLQKYLSGDPGQYSTGLDPVKRKDTELPVDIAVLEGLVGNDPAIHASLLQKFVISLNDILGDMRLAFDAKSMVEIKALAHKLKGPAKSIGAERLAQICIELEKAGKAENMDEINRWRAPLQDEAETVAQFIQNM
ncbi:MAG: response regulator [Gammaproteobacteria bacterium]|nr:response regulator [Gammaproteobacteria bacterium]MDH5801720.1 response regulator [Gammaproteobacteria bacterium]